MIITLSLSLLVISAFVSTSPTPAQVSIQHAELEPRHWCDPTYEYNDVLRALLDPRHSRSALGFCRTFISVPVITVSATAARVSNAIHVSA
jgi:hypothetical protein